MPFFGSDLVSSWSMGLTTPSVAEAGRTGSGRSSAGSAGRRHRVRASATVPSSDSSGRYWSSADDSITRMSAIRTVTTSGCARRLLAASQTLHRARRAAALEIVHEDDDLPTCHGSPVADQAAELLAHLPHRAPRRLRAWVVDELRCPLRGGEDVLADHQGPARAGPRSTRSVAPRSPLPGRLRGLRPPARSRTPGDEERARRRRRVRRGRAGRAGAIGPLGVSIAAGSGEPNRRRHGRARSTVRATSAANAAPRWVASSWAQALNQHTMCGCCPHSSRQADRRCSGRVARGTSCRRPTGR